MESNEKIYVQVIPIMDGAATTIRQQLSSIDLSDTGRAMGNSLLSSFKTATSGIEAEISSIQNTLTGSIQRIFDATGLEHFSTYIGSVSSLFDGLAKDITNTFRNIASGNFSFLEVQTPGWTTFAAVLGLPLRRLNAVCSTFVPIISTGNGVFSVVIGGLWGNNPQRVKKLTAAGYDAAAVQKRVNELLLS